MNQAPTRNKNNQIRRKKGPSPIFMSLKTYTFICIQKGGLDESSPYKK